MPAPDPDAIADLWPVDGPFSLEHTQSAARVIAELTRYLAYATMSAAGTPNPGTVSVVLGNLSETLARMPQVLTQLHRRFAELSAQPGATMVPPTEPTSDPAPHIFREYADVTAAYLDLAEHAIGRLRSLADRLDTSGDTDQQ